MSRWRTATAGVAHFFAVGEAWERPAPAPEQRRTHLLLALGFWAVGAVSLELVRSFAGLEQVSQPVWVQHLAVATGTLLLVWRRRWPLSVVALSAIHMFVVGVTMPSVMSQLPLQVAYFFALYTGVAWARDRRLMLVVVGGVLTLMFGWLTWAFAVGKAAEDIVRSDRVGQGLLSPVAAAVLFAFILNIIYFGGALLIGQVAWRGAHQTAQVAEQARTIAAQARRLRDQAVLEERLRIARELHDVVAHHVSVMGVQAAAARSVLAREPHQAAASLANIEQSSREAVAQMRGLLGTLRTPQDDDDDKESSPSSARRAPEPGVADIPALVEQAVGPGLAVSYSLVEDRPAAAADVPAPVGLSLYRTIQEALANVRRHSTASQARVVVRMGDEPGGPCYAEAEVLDNGRPRGGTSSTGLGLVGLRERIASHGGTSEIGPRVTGGYRVRVRFPFRRPAAGTDHPTTAAESAEPVGRPS